MKTVKLGQAHAAIMKKGQPLRISWHRVCAPDAIFSAVGTDL